MSIWGLLIDQGLTNAGFFMLFPLLTVYLTRDLGFDATSAGLVLGMRQLIQQGAAPLGGALSDRVGYKPAILAGFVIRIVGFLVYAVSTDPVGIVTATVVTALAGSFFDPPARAALAHLTPERERQGVYAAGGTANWIGQVVGPLVGAVLLPFSFTWVCLAAASAFLIAAIQAAVVLPSGMRGDVGTATIWVSIRAALRDGEFARFTALLLGYFFLATQVVITVPILTSRLAGPSAIGLVFAIQAGLSMVLQVPVARWVSRRIGPIQQMVLAMVLLAVGFGGYGFVRDFPQLALSTVVVALGQILVAPVQPVVTARLAGGRGGAYFGVGALALAVGGSLGAATGGMLMDLGDRLDAPWVPWMAMAAIGLVTALGYVRLSRDRRLLARLSTRPRPATG